MPSHRRTGQQQASRKADDRPNDSSSQPFLLMLDPVDGNHTTHCIAQSIIDLHTMFHIFDFLSALVMQCESAWGISIVKPQLRSWSRQAVHDQDTAVRRASSLTVEAMHGRRISGSAMPHSISSLTIRSDTTAHLVEVISNLRIAVLDAAQQTSRRLPVSLTGYQLKQYRYSCRIFRGYAKLRRTKKTNESKVYDSFMGIITGFQKDDDSLISATNCAGTALLVFDEHESFLKRHVVEYPHKDPWLASWQAVPTLWDVERIAQYNLLNPIFRLIRDVGKILQLEEDKAFIPEYGMREVRSRNG